MNSEKWTQWRVFLHQIALDPFVSLLEIHDLRTNDPWVHRQIQDHLPVGVILKQFHHEIHLVKCFRVKDGQLLLLLNQLVKNRLHDLNLILFFFHLIHKGLEKLHVNSRGLETVDETIGNLGIFYIK